MGRHARTHLRDTAFKPVPIWLSPLTSFHKTATHSWVENSRNTGNLQSLLGHLPHTKHLTTLLTNLTTERNTCSLPKLKCALLEPFSGTSFKGLLDRQMPQREKLVLAGNSNSTMMLHTAKDGFKVFLATKKKHKRQSLSAQPLKQKSKQRNTGQNLFSWSISPRPTKEQVYTPCTGLMDDGQSTKQQTLSVPPQDSVSFTPCCENSSSGGTAICQVRLPHSQPPLQLKVANQNWPMRWQLGMLWPCPSSFCHAWRGNNYPMSMAMKLPYC